ncbi:MAG: PQQ-binding-like beta-propeller repeat protein [Gemmataceae bacterium]
MRAVASLLALPLFLAFPLQAQDKLAWARFRGPDGLGLATGKAPTNWSQKENLAFKTALPGMGTSSPIVVGERIYLTCYAGFGAPGDKDMSKLKRLLVCLDAKGDILWSKEVASKLPEQERIRDDHGYASSTPVCDGERLYVFFGKSGVLAFTLEGEKLWQADVGERLNDWGSAASPVLFGDLVIVNASVESGSLIALDRKTGKERWRAKGIVESWNTPILVTPKGEKTELVVAIMGKVLGFDPETGAPLWSCATDIPWYMVPSGVPHDGVVYYTGGRGGGGTLAVRAGGTGDVTKTHRLWMIRKGTNVPSPILHKGRLYFASEGGGLLYCVDAASGKVIYEEREPRADAVYASPILADGKLYYLTRTGATLVVAAGPEMKVLATNDLRDRGAFNASPAVMGNRLLIRSDKYLYGIGK